MCFELFWNLLTRCWRYVLKYGGCGSGLEIFPQAPRPRQVQNYPPRKKWSYINGTMLKITYTYYACVCDRLISIYIYKLVVAKQTYMIIKCAYCIAASRYYRFVLLSIISSCWTECCCLWRDSNTSRWRHWICSSQKPGSKALVGEARIRLGTIKTSSEVVYLERRSVLKLSAMQRFASPCGTFLSNIGISGHSCIGTTLMAPHHTNSNDFDQVSHPSP